MTESALAAELLQEGIAAVKAGDKQAARERLMQVVELDERNEQAWLWLSGVVESTEDKRACLENVLAINPNNTHAQSGLAWIRQNEPDPSPAGERCPRCQAQASPSETSCARCGLPLIVACPACGQYADVERSACPACGHHLGDFRQGVGYHLALAQDYLDRRHLDRAQEAITRAQSESPSDPQVLAAAAGLYEQTGRPDLAIAAYQEAIQQDPSNPAPYSRLGALYRQRGQSEEAQAMYHKAAELAGGDPDSILELARISLQEEGTADSAIGLLNQVLEQQPMNAEASLLLGDAYLKKQHHQQAIEYYERACKLAPSNSNLGRQARSKLVQLQPPTPQGASTGRTHFGKTGKRPGCVTAYAVLTMLLSGCSLVGALGGIVAMSASQGIIEEMTMSQGMLLPDNSGLVVGALWISTFFTLFMAGINIAVAIGLWSMKNWARIATIVLTSLSAGYTLLQITGYIITLRGAAGNFGMSEFAATGADQATFEQMIQFMTTSMACVTVIVLAIYGVIIFWFYANRELFD